MISAFATQGTLKIIMVGGALTTQISIIIQQPLVKVSYC